MAGGQRVGSRGLVCAAAAAAAGLLAVCGCVALAGAAPEGAAAQGATAGASATLIASPESGWPQWRGPRRDGVCDEKGLLQRWPEGGPRVMWSAGSLGRGYSAPIVAGGRIFLTGEAGDGLYVYALDMQGKPLWRSRNGAAWKGPYPGSRASCAYAAGRIYNRSAVGRVACYDAATGRERWAVDTVQRFGTRAPTWGLGECLLVDGPRVLVTAGGTKALMAALDARTGATVWTTPPLLLGPSQPPDHVRVPEPAGEADGGSYASPVLFALAGKRYVAGCSLRHAFCVDAGSGKLLWTRPMKTLYSVIGITPALVGDALFFTAPDGEGGKLLRLRPHVGGMSVEETWRTTLDTCHGGVIYHDGTLYGTWYRRPAWGYLDARTGAVRSQSTDNTMGSMLYADGRLYFLTQNGEMLLVDPAPAGPRVVGRFRLVPDRRDDVWAHPVVCGGRLYLRYHDTLTCYDVRARG